jgi:hypothetical protein
MLLESGVGFRKRLLAKARDDGGLTTFALL